MIKGNDPENIKNGSTLSLNEFAGMKFDFMLSNPPYGKSWSSEQRYIKDDKKIIDSRFVVSLSDYWGNFSECDATPRSSDGQLLFLMEMVDKIKPTLISKLGSHIASVHNGSSLFTGDAGGGESNIRRYIIENDLLDAIIQLPNNLFYNTGITTYIWILSNNKPAHRQGKTQLIDASELYSKLRKNLGDKNCELEPKHITKIMQIYENFQTCDEFVDDKKISSKIFSNSDFGYYKVNIERPKRLKAQFKDELIKTLKFDKSLEEPMKWCLDKFKDECFNGLHNHKKEIEKYLEAEELELNARQKNSLISKELWQKHQILFASANRLKQEIGTDEYSDFNAFKELVSKAIKKLDIKLSAMQINTILNAVSWQDESAAKVIKKISKINKEKLENLLAYLRCSADELENFGYFKGEKRDEYIEYESDSDLRDSENIALKDSILNYFLKEVKPHVNDAWINIDSVKIGYEISFNRYFYTHKPLRSIDEVASEILELEKLSDGLIKGILGE